MQCVIAVVRDDPASSTKGGNQIPRKVSLPLVEPWVMRRWINHLKKKMLLIMDLYCLLNVKFIMYCSLH